MKDWRLILQLSIADMMYERRLTLAMAAAVAAIVLPILIVLSLREGIVGTMFQKLSSHPATRELQPVGNVDRPASFFDMLEKRPDVAFLIPTTRYLAANMELVPEGEQGRPALTISFFPSRSGDPALGPDIQAPSSFTDIVLSKPVAEDLQIGEGDRVIGIIERGVGSVSYSRQEITLTVVGVLPIQQGDDLVSYVHPRLAYAVEDFREFFGADEISDSSDTDHAQRQFASFRLYATTIDTVEPLRDWLAKRGLRLKTELAQISLLKSLQAAFDTAVQTVIVIGGTGIALTLACFFWLNIDRKEKHMAAIATIGLPPLSLSFIPIFQACFMGLTGAFTSVIITKAGILLIELADKVSIGEITVRGNLSLASALTVILLTAVFCMLAAVVPAFRLSRLDPAKGVSDV